MKAFISYSHRDERFRISLETHLSLLKRNGVLDVWHDRRIGAGSDIDEQIDENLEAAQLVLALISPDFIASDYCYSKELRRAMEKHEANEARVVPVILRPVDWRTAPFAKLMALPKDGKPITTWKNRDEAFLDVAHGIRRVVEGLHLRHPSEKASPGMIVYDYQGSVVQVGGVGSRLVTKRAWLVTEHAFLRADDFITHSFNIPGDIMWISCPPEFRIVGARSPTGNDVFPMVEGEGEDTPYGIRVEERLQNTIVVTCKRKEETRTPPRATGTRCPKCGDAMAPYQQYCRECGFSWGSERQ